MRKYSPNSSATPGVNLGGWLVLEKWMTPSVFAKTDATNEYELSQTEIGIKRIQRHRQTFIQEDDIKWLSRVGIKLLRLPIGYWAIEDQPPYVSAKPQIDWLMDAAERHGLKVLLDLHAAPGAQNASDHSGSGNTNKVQWYKRANRQKTTQILLNIADEYGYHPALWGIELLNEPLVATWYRRWQLWRWTQKTSQKLRGKLPPRVRIVASDCYQPAWWSGRIGNNTLDIHHYQCFSDKDNQATALAYHQKLLSQQSNKYRDYSRQQPIIIGEWSAALPPRIASSNTEFAHCQSQLAIPSNVDAWFYWSYKTENPGAWNFRDCYSKSWFNDTRPHAADQLNRQKRSRLI